MPSEISGTQKTAIMEFYFIYEVPSLSKFWGTQSIIGSGDKGIKE